MSDGFKTEVKFAPAPAATPKTWIQRRAERFKADVGGEVDDYVLAMEAAIEMRCVVLKIALARCYEILVIADKNETVPCLNEDFLDHLLELIR